MNSMAFCTEVKNPPGGFHIWLFFRLGGFIAGTSLQHPHPHPHPSEFEFHVRVCSFKFDFGFSYSIAVQV